MSFSDRPGEMDLLEQRGSGGRPRRRTFVVAAVFLVLAAAAWQVDAQVRERERSALEACAAAAERAVNRSGAHLSFMGSHVAPVLSSSPSPDVRRGLLRLMEGAADRGRAQVRQAVVTCRDASVWPHHGELRGVRTAYVDHLSAELAWLNEVTRDGGVAFVPDPALAELRERVDDAAKVLAG